MPLGLTDRRRFVEQQLFDIELRLDRARHELELVAGRLSELRVQVHAAEARLGASETALAGRECSAARERVAAMSSTEAAARHKLADLECARDGLLTKLVG